MRLQIAEAAHLVWPTHYSKKMSDRKPIVAKEKGRDWIVPARCARECEKLGGG